MEEHLGTDCLECGKALKLWRQVFDIASRESQYAAPEDAVRLAKSQFAIHSLHEAKPRRSFIARLVFDSFQQPALQGVRSLVAGPRHLLFQSGPFQLDMRIETSSTSRQVSLVGQVLHAAQPTKVLHNTSVQLFKRKNELAAANINEFGEFHLEFEKAEELRLVLLIEGRRILVPLHVDTFRMRNSGN